MQPRGQNSIHVAFARPAWEWDLDISLLASHVHAFTAVDQDGRTPLHYAAMNG